jgi:hypothetical protein
LSQAEFENDDGEMADEHRFGFIDSSEADKRNRKMERTIEVRHVSLEINASFESFTQALERSLGRFDYTLYKDLETDPRSVEERLKASAGEEGLMLFNVQEHGRLLNIVGSQKKPSSTFWETH